MKFRILSLLFLLLLIYTASAQQFGPANDEQSLEEVFWESMQTQGTAMDSLVVWQEQVLLHTDKALIGPKDHLFFKAYVLTGPEQLRVSASDVLKVELLDENGLLVTSQYHKISNGATEGSLMIPKKAKSGKHYLRAYTRWMLNYGPENFATQEISVVDKRSSFPNSVSTSSEVQIFPEGGTLIAGLENRVVVGLGNSANKQMEVVDENENIVAKVKHYGNGLGTFLLTPGLGNKYYLKLREGSRVALPEVGEAGYTMQLNTIGSENIVVKIAATKNIKNQEAYLRGWANVQQWFEYKIQFDGANSIEVDIPKSNLPNGMFQLRLEDEFDQVWAKRPLHIDNRQLHFEVEKSSDIKGDLVKIRVTDSEGIPVQTELSVALGRNGENAIQSANLDTPRNQRFVNDLLVLANRLPKDDVLNKVAELPTEIQYNFQEGLEFYGRAYDLDAVPLPNTKIQIVISGAGKAVAHEVMTNEEGLFQLSGLQIEGEASMVFRKIGEESRDKFVKVVPYQYEIPPLKIKNSKETKGLNSKQFIPKKQVAEFKADENSERLITLEGVTLVGEKPKSSKTPSLYNIEPTRVVVQDPQRPKTIPQLFLNIPGVQVRNLGDLTPSLVLPRSAGVGSPLWVVDGLPLSKQPVEGLTPLAEIMNIVPFIDVERIEILMGAKAAVFGSRASGGVILIYTRNGSDEEYLNRKKGQLTFEGYHKSIEFNEYSMSPNSKKETTQNNTVYWNPTLETNENGEAIIELPKFKTPIGLKLDLKAITPDGKKGALGTIIY